MKAVFSRVPAIHRGEALKTVADAGMGGDVGRPAWAEEELFLHGPICVHPASRFEGRVSISSCFRNACPPKPCLILILNSFIIEPILYLTVQSPQDCPDAKVQIRVDETGSLRRFIFNPME